MNRQGLGFFSDSGRDNTATEDFPHDFLPLLTAARAERQRKALRKVLEADTWHPASQTFSPPPPRPSEIVSFLTR